MSSNNRAKRENRKNRVEDTRRANEQAQRNASNADNFLDSIDYKPASSRPLEPLNPVQAMHKESLIHDQLVIAIGSAGTGKTYLSAGVAAELYLGNHCKKLILTRPNVEVGKSLGYLPGDKAEKYAPYLEPFKQALIDRLGSNKFKCDFNSRIAAHPLQYMRGMTFDDSIILLDEAQNTSIEEMKMLITRVGVNSKLFITGDINQSDLGRKKNGLSWLVREIRRQQKSYDIIEYTSEYCVRSGLCMDMLKLIENAED